MKPRPTRDSLLLLAAILLAFLALTILANLIHT